MTKIKNKFAIFDVRVGELHMLAKRRREKLEPHLNEKVVAYSYCSASDDQALAQWRKDAEDARVLSILSHGTDGAINACTGARLYWEDDGRFPEIEGAIVHLLACSTANSLAVYLVKEQGATAVIGYTDRWTFGVLDGEDLGDAAEFSLDCDTEILAGLSAGQSIADSLKGSEALARKKLKELAVATGGEADSDLEKAAWKYANLETNRSFLAANGNQEVAP